MVVGCGNTCVKYFFFLVNLLICILGALVFGFSLWANLDKNFTENLAEFIRKIDGPTSHTHIDAISKYQACLWILVGVGALLFFVGFLGCCGAGCESPILLGLFFFIIFILTLIEVGATVYAVVYRDQFVNTVQQVLELSSKTPAARQNIKPIQDLFQCCGATKDTQHLYIDDRLCIPDHVGQPDCFDRISHMIESSGEVVVVIGSLLILVEVLSLIFSCLLCRASREIRYAGYY